MVATVASTLNIIKYPCSNVNDASRVTLLIVASLIISYDQNRPVLQVTGHALNYFRKTFIELNPGGKGGVENWL